MEVLTNFADQAVVLPLALILLIVLAAAGWTRGALAWAAAVAVTFALTVAAKIAIYAYGSPIEGLQSASGHTAAGTVVYGGLLVLILGRSMAITLALPLAALIAGVFGVTRLALGVHTLADALAGAALGIIGVVLLARMAGPRPAGLPRLRLLLAAAVVAFALHGQQLHAEGLFQAIAATIEARR